MGLNRRIDYRKLGATGATLYQTDAMTTISTADGHPLVVRRLVAADAVALQAFNPALSPQTLDWFVPHAYDDRTVAKILARSEARDDYILGVFDDDRIAGYFFLWYFTHRVPLLGIGLIDEFQDRGLGRQMMQILIDAAKENGNEGIALTTMLDNHRAFALYEKLGFKYEGDVENVTGDGDVVVERGMFYPIKPGARGYDGNYRPPV